TNSTWLGDDSYPVNFILQRNSFLDAYESYKIGDVNAYKKIVHVRRCISLGATRYTGNPSFKQQDAIPVITQVCYITMTGRATIVPYIAEGNGSAPDGMGKTPENFWNATLPGMQPVLGLEASILHAGCNLSASQKTVFKDSQAASRWQNCMGRF
ncbi:hypothetical protein K469DRAFT_560857, partial [Zopfia rhizophila CBS 207.26]